VEACFEKRVLLIDDEAAALRAFSRGLRSLGYEPIAAGSIAEARDVLSEWSLHACALALVDYRLEDGLGIDLLPELSALVPAPTIALISGFLNSDVATRAFKGGALPMAKPGDAETLRELLDILAHLRQRTRASGSSNPPRSSDSSPDISAARLVFGPFALDGRSLQTPSGARKLRHAESKLLAHLALRRPGAVGLDELARVVLGRDDDGGRRSVYSHVTNLRLSLGPYAALVETEHKYGYRLALERFAA
jgi:DNA-binding response OmpR family regulator